MLTLEQVKKKIYEYGNYIDIDENSTLYPIFSETPQVFDEGPSIYILNLEYHYVIMERGVVRKHHISKNFDDILYLVFSNITFTLAKNYELNNRIGNGDFRRVLWEKQLELLNKINKNFSNIRKQEIDKTLKISPYKDNN